MNRHSTLFLMTIIILLALAVLALCIFVLPAGILSDESGGYRYLFIGMYLPAIPFFIGIRHALKLLSNIDQQKTFSLASINSLQTIKYCGITIGSLYAVGMPYIFTLAQRDDAPGVVLIGLIFTVAPFIISILAAVLQKIFHNALTIKSEHDLIV